MAMRSEAVLWMAVKLEAKAEAFGMLGVAFWDWSETVEALRVAVGW